MDEYAQQQDSYFVSEAVFLLLPGNHSLHLAVSLRNVYDVVIMGMENNSVTVFCRTALAIQCQNVTNLKIQSIAFHLYSGHDNEDNIASVLSIRYSQVLLSKLTFQQTNPANITSSISRSILCTSSNITIISCLFQGNTGDDGGAIRASARSYITLIASVFIENRALRSGGAIYLLNSSLIMNENSFINNSAIISYNDSEQVELLPNVLQSYTMGGALFLGNHSVAILSGTVVTFQDNSADIGGAICSNRSIVTSNTKKLHFIENRAQIGGSGYFGDHSILKSEECNFGGNFAGGNSGGALLCQNGIVKLTGNSQFNRNVGIGYGGAVNVNNCTLDISDAASFIGNHATSGGAIYLVDTIAVLNGKVIDFVNNSAGFAGGAIASDTSTITTNTEHLSFTGNTAQRVGGAFFGEQGFLNLGGLETNIHHFANNSAGRNSGGAIHYQHGNLTLSANSNFLRNFVTYVGIDGNGGAINLLDCNFSLAGKASFAQNQAEQGAGLYMAYTTAIINGTAIDFINNSANTMGGGIGIGLSTLLVTKRSHMSFIANSALQGGGLMSINSSIKLESVKFINNMATEIGGAMTSGGDTIACFDVNITGNSGSAVSLFSSKLSFSGIITISKNTGRIGGGISAKASTIAFTGVTKIEGNMAEVSGGAISGNFKTIYSFSGNTSFRNNRAGFFGGAIHGYIKIKLILSGVSLFENNTVDTEEETKLYNFGGGGAIFASDTHISLKDTVNFTLNVAQNGGAMYFENGATLVLEPNTTLSTSYNSATKYGGAIYHTDGITPSQCTFLMRERTPDTVLTLPNCFIDLKEIRLDQSRVPFAIHSSNDSAGMGGSFMYGGLMDKCRIFSLVPSTLYVNATEVKSDILYSVLMDYEVFKSKETDVIASEVYILCFCVDNQEFNCSKVTSIETYRGQTFSVPLLALSQGDTITSTLLTAKLSRTARLELNQSTQALSQNCTNVAYTLYSTEEYEELIVYPNGSCRDTGQAQAVIHVNFQSCPDAFTLSGDRCSCEERLQKYNTECVIYEDEIHIARKAHSKLWLHALYTNGTYKGLILYPTCPADYCKTEAVNITLAQQDVQCDLNRSGMLCGACAANYSLLLGSSKCEVCSNSFLALLPLFAAAGIVLVFILSVLRFTVSTGMINSIILYANIVQANKSLFFPSSTNFLTVFIAWMNLDLGFQTCFYDGMDAYAQTFLQFVFPVYVWVLISLIIFASRYSIFLTRLIGSNPIAVLATLLLMSYTKILKIVITVYSFGRLDYPNNATQIVWLRDANVPYLKSRHLFLTVVTSIVFIFFFLPYTLFLLLGFKLYRFSGRKHFRWLMNKIKPLLDSYYAPYTKHTRYWTGFLLLVRCALYVVFSFNSLGATITDKGIIVAFTSIIVIAWLSVKIYKSFYANAIEASVYLNLIVLSVFTPSSSVLVYSLVGMVFATTMAINVYHIHLTYTAKSKLWLKIVEVLKKTLMKSHNSEATETTPLFSPAQASSSDPHKIVTKSVITLREPLLESDN